MRFPWLPAILLASASLFGLLAAAIWVVSDAHGHGLTSGDRNAIVALVLVAVASSVVGALVLFRR